MKTKYSIIEITTSFYVYCKICDLKVKSMTDYFYGLNNVEYFVSDKCN